MVVTSGGGPFVDHDDDRADEAAGGGDGLARTGVVSEYRQPTSVCTTRRENVPPVKFGVIGGGFAENRSADLV